MVSAGERPVLRAATRRIETIYAEYRDEPGLAHLRRGTKFVPGEGNPTSPKFMFIGEAPGVQEDKHERPFVGMSGNLLDSMLYVAGVKRTDIWITNVVKNRPPDNRTPTLKEMEVAATYLRREVVAVRPKVLVLLGGTALTVVDSNRRVGNCHGKPWTIGSWTYVALYHPAYILRNPELRESYEADFRKLRELV